MVSCKYGQKKKQQQNCESGSLFDSLLYLRKDIKTHFLAVFIEVVIMVDRFVFWLIN